MYNSLVNSFIIVVQINDECIVKVSKTVLMWLSFTKKLHLKKYL